MSEVDELDEFWKFRLICGIPFITVYFYDIPAMCGCVSRKHEIFEPVANISLEIIYGGSQDGVQLENKCFIHYGHGRTAQISLETYHHLSKILIEKAAYLSQTGMDE